MTHRRNNVNQLDGVISALEQFILTASDREITADGASEARYVKDIIDKSIAKCDTSTKSRVSDMPSRSKPKRRRSKTLGDWQSRIAFFRDLMVMHPDLSPRLGTVFGAGRTPSSEELDKLTDEFIQLGLISKNGLKKK